MRTAFFFSEEPCMFVAEAQSISVDELGPTACSLKRAIHEKHLAGGSQLNTMRNTSKSGPNPLHDQYDD